MTRTPLRAFAPAKLNLHLHVGPPLADGRHPLESLAAFADVGDVLTAALADTLTLRVEGPFGAALAEEADNLVLRAGRALAERYGVTRGAALVLDKQLPVASGIGGGSADAAAALRLLAALWELPVEPAALEALARPLGSDVPVCVRCRPAFMTGGGEDVEEAALAPLDGVLVNPLQPLPTGPVYRMFDQMGLGGDFARGAPPAPGEDLLAWLAARRNDLEAPARRMSPAVGAVLGALAARPEAALVRMSGSGASCFAVSRNRQDALALASAVAEANPGWWVRPIRIGAVDATVTAV